KRNRPGQAGSGGSWCAAESAGLHFPDVRRLRALGALGDLELHLLTLCEAAEALHLDGRVVDEHVLAASVGSDEAIAFRIVEPLHGTSRHPSLPFASG